MSAAPRHARRSRLARFTASLTAPPAPGTDGPLTRVLMPGLGVVYVQARQETPSAAGAWDRSPETMARVLTAFRAPAAASDDDSSEGAAS